MRSGKVFVICSMLIVSTWFCTSGYSQRRTVSGTTVPGSSLTQQSDSIAVNVALLHLYPALKNLTYNIGLLNQFTEKAFEGGASIVVAPELVTTGYCITADDVRNGLGLSAPFTQLSVIRQLAMKYNGYVIAGIAEIGSDSNLYNSAIMFKPDGSYFIQRKRGIAMWNNRGNLPFNVVPTPYGNIGIAICSDTYLMDWVRIMTINGADIIITPANWWGDAGQLNTWTNRAYENGVQMIVANRWGTETDNRFSPPFTYDMNDAPSAVIRPGADYTIDPGEQIALVYRANEMATPADTILYAPVMIARSRLSNNNTWMYRARQAAAYPQIANPYYRPDEGNQPAPGFPPAGIVQAGCMSWWPNTDYHVNLTSLYNYWNNSNRNADVLVLPSFAVSTGLIAGQNPDWYKVSPWTDLQQFIESNSIQLLVTTSFQYIANQPNVESAVIFRPGQQPLLVPAIHGWSPALPYPVPPLYFDLDSARVGIILDHDALLPETILDLSKAGSDLIVFPFDYGTSAFKSSATSADNWPFNLLQTSSNVVTHIVASNDYGFGMCVVNGGGYIQQLVTTNADSGNAFQIIPLDSRLVRTKYLNAYYDFDLQTLLGYAAPIVAVRPERMPAQQKLQRPLRKQNKKARTTVGLTDEDLRRQVLPPGLRPEKTPGQQD
jgi:predicted amidohydrolase